MKVYMVNYQQMNRVGDTWVKSESKHSFFIFAENKEDANNKLEAALQKVNAYANGQTKYCYPTQPKLIDTLSVTHDIHNGTSVTGIWG